MTYKLLESLAKILPVCSLSHELSKSSCTSSNETNSRNFYFACKSRHWINSGNFLATSAGLFFINCDQSFPDFPHISKSKKCRLLRNKKTLKKT